MCPPPPFERRTNTAPPPRENPCASGVTSARGAAVGATPRGARRTVGRRECRRALSVRTRAPGRAHACAPSGRGRGSAELVRVCAHRCHGALRRAGSPPPPNSSRQSPPLGHWDWLAPLQRASGLAVPRSAQALGWRRRCRRPAEGGGCTEIGRGECGPVAGGGGLGAASHRIPLPFRLRVGAGAGARAGLGGAACAGPGGGREARGGAYGGRGLEGPGWGQGS